MNGKLKECSCGKIISADLSTCWECWYSNGKEKYHKKRRQCTCGIDITDYDYLHYISEGAECPHKRTPVKVPSGIYEEKPRVTRKIMVNDIEDQPLKDDEFHREIDKVYLLVKIDEALDRRDQELFMELTEKLKRLEELTLV